MREHLALYAPALTGALLSLVLWFWLSRRLAAKDASRWRAVPLCLTLLLITAGYGLFWFGFFATPKTAVQLHAVRLSITYLAGDALPWIGMAWLALSGFLLLPLWRKATR